MLINGTFLNQLNGVAISAVAKALPNGMHKLDNAAIHQLIYGENWEAIFAEKHYNANYIFNELGYSERFWTHEPGTPITKNELTSGDLMVVASNAVILESDVDKTAIDMLIAVTVTSPKYTNSMGAFVAGNLGLNCPAMEIKTGCASALYAIVMAAQFIRSGARNVLVTAGETPTKVTDKKGNLIYAVGDAGAAVILSKGDSHKGISTAFLGTQGQYSGAMGSAGLLPPNIKDLNDNAYNMVMGKESEAFIKSAWQHIPNMLYAKSGLSANDIDFLVPHQVNKQLMQLVIEASAIDSSKTINIIDKYANCGSVGVILALEEAYRLNNKLINKNIMMIAVGGGVSYGGLIINL